MKRVLQTCLLISMAITATGCCLFRCYDGDPDPVETLTPKRVPLQIANDLVLRLSTVFYDEGRKHTIYFRPLTTTSPQLKRVMEILKPKLSREPHIEMAPKATAEYELVVVTSTSPNGAAAVFSVVQKGKVIWTHSEPLVGEKSN